MNNCAIFCTCAEKNQDYYFQRIELWYKMLKDISDVDFYCCNDGKIITTIPDSIKNNVKFIELQPTLGRSSCWQFEGFKRSFGYMLNFLKEYKYVTHIESDVKINNFEKFLFFLKKNGMYSSICQKYHFIETAFLIMNDKIQREKLSKYFTNDVNIRLNELFEWKVVNLVKFEYPFLSIRKEKSFILNEDKYDIIAQNFG